MKAVAIGRTLDIPARTVRGIIARFRANPEDVKDRPRSGRPRITTPRQDRSLTRDARRHRFQNARVLRYRWYALYGARASHRTTLRRLNGGRLRARRPLKKLPLSVRHRHVRLQWARRHAARNIRFWRRVHFSDESRFNLYDNDGRLRVWRSSGERRNAACVERRHAYGGASIMVWGCISFGCKLPLVEIQGNMNAQRYCDDVLTAHAVPHIDNHPLQDHPVYMHDGATPHTAHITQDLLRQEAVDVLDWPSRSPDMNPIENMWDYLKRELNSPNNIIRNVADLRFEIHRIWNDIPQASIRRLIYGCRRRVNALLAARGDFTQY